jgi:hypothetical protein
MTVAVRSRRTTTMDVAMLLGVGLMLTACTSEPAADDNDAASDGCHRHSQRGLG